MSFLYAVDKLTPDFVGNEQEYLRRSNNSVIDERTLHEIYLEPFRLQIKANPSVFVRQPSQSILMTDVELQSDPWCSRC